uniref:NADH-ubiquinone oxidoreductase chain 2 n=1 Tax=Vagitanus terminalis TaxID=2170276 RepID=A0A344AM08_9HEMI|nr:NADH dehydrogenase subunit 2 [Vagitanus terminalis]
MKYNSSFIIFFIFLVLGILISLNSISWLGCWLGIEINMVSYLPMMLEKTNMYSSESMIKYFIIQSIGSSLFFMSIIFIDMFMVIHIMLISLLIKIGCPPFHYWYISVMYGLSWMLSFVLMTIQKIIPVLMVSYLECGLELYVVTSGIWGCMGGLCYSSIRKIMGYSSIYNLSWIFGGMLINNYSWMIYFLIYSLTLLLICNLMSNHNINYLNQLFLFSSSIFKSILMLMIFLSMSGLPPFVGFLPKFMVISGLLSMNMSLLSLFLLMTALLTLFFYLRIAMTGLMINFYSISTLCLKIDWYSYTMGYFLLFGMILLNLISIWF